MASLIGVAFDIAKAAVSTTVSRWTRGRGHPDWGWRDELGARFLRAAFQEINGASPEEQRRRFENQALESPMLGKVTVSEESIEGIACEWIVPRQGEALGLMVYLHGGGFVMGSPRTHRDLTIRLALAAQCKVCVVDYRLAPEHPYPAALDDACAVVEALRARDASTPMVIAGDSAGGNLTATTALRLIREGKQAPDGLVMICPLVDFSDSHASLESNEAYDFLTRSQKRVWEAAYLSGHDPLDPVVSPLFAELGDLPPTLVQVGGAELLRDEGLDFAKRAREQGAEVQVTESPGMVHDWHFLALLVPKARAAIKEIGEFCRSRWVTPVGASLPNASDV